MPVAHHQRPCGEISQPLAAAVDEERQHADGVENWEKVDDPDQVTDGGLPDAQRLSMIPDHSQPGGTLAQRLPVPGGLADQKIARQQDKPEDDFDQDGQFA